jgi:osmotically-inducible protein OsmY
MNPITQPPTTASPTRISTPSPTSSSGSTVLAKKVRVASTTSEQLNFFEVQVISSGANVALLGTASQSSTLNNNAKFAASKAIDADNTSFSHTADSQAWWEVTLSDTVEVESIVILNRWCQNVADAPGCMCRLTGATISLLDQNDVQVGTANIGDTCGQQIVSQAFSASRSISADKVRLESTTSEQLNIFEVEVYSSGANVALSGTASQSSTLNAFAAGKAIDGGSSTFSHTNDSSAWWEVNLNGSVDISSIVIKNRWCGDENDTKGCLCRLSSATLALYENGSIVATRALGDTCNELVVSVTF